MEGGGPNGRKQLWNF